jgi:hypothetical protein
MLEVESARTFNPMITGTDVAKEAHVYAMAEEGTLNPLFVHANGGKARSADNLETFTVHAAVDSGVTSDMEKIYNARTCVYVRIEDTRGAEESDAQREQFPAKQPSIACKDYLTPILDYFIRALWVLRVLVHVPCVLIGLVLTAVACIVLVPLYRNEMESLKWLVSGFFTGTLFVIGALVDIVWLPLVFCVLVPYVRSARWSDYDDIILSQSFAAFGVAIFSVFVLMLMDVG